jgi:four helix bundle protein
LSIPLNIAEGSGRGIGKNPDAQRFYGIARGSALECAAILDVFEAMGLATDHEAKELLERVVSMLTRLVAPNPASDA